MVSFLFDAARVRPSSAYCKQGYIVFASMIKSSLKWGLISPADVKNRRHFQGKSIGGIRVNVVLC